jgi:DNA polymerase
MRKDHDITASDARAALEWLIAMGADEIVEEAPVNRLAAISPPSPAVSVRPAIATMPAAQRTDPAVAAEASACATLEDIAAALSNLDACPLKKTATNLCFFDGNPQAQIMLVGEAPGRDEDIQGKPFVGRSGQLLDRMLAAIGLSRNGDRPENSVFVSNVIFWRPPGNRTPTEQETLMCLPYLKRTIEIVSPRMIVCLGATPTQRLVNAHDGILKLRGKWFSLEAGSRPIPLLATLHPAYLLRQPAQKRLAWRDFLALKMALSSGSA